MTGASASFNLRRFPDEKDEKEKPMANTNGSIATTVSVEVEVDGFDIWHAHSKDVFGLELCARDREKVIEAIPEAIKFLYRENHGVEVSVRRLCRAKEFPARSVVVDDRYLLEFSHAA